jgi:phenylalanyl-tRNA synthetase beta chain
VRDVMLGCGFDEAMPNPFLAPEDLERAGLTGDALTISNPLAAEESVLRTSLRPGLLGALAYNASHQMTGVALFEVGHVYLRAPEGAELPDEREMLAAALAGRDATAAVEVWAELAGALGVDGVELIAATRPGLHPSRTDVLVAPDGTELGVVGEIEPAVLDAYGLAGRVSWLEVDLGRLLDLPHGEGAYRRVSRYPSSDLDLAFILDDAVPAARLTAALRDAGGPTLAEVRLFDVYRGAGVPDGHRSLAYRLRLQAPDRTLTDADTAATRSACVDAAASLGATLRG